MDFPDLDVSSETLVLPFLGHSSDDSSSYTRSIFSVVGFDLFTLFSENVDETFFETGRESRVFLQHTIVKRQHSSVGDE